MRQAKSFSLPSVFQQINARREEINEEMRYNRRIGQPQPAALTEELAVLAAQENDSLHFDPRYHFAA
jgi:hypothetical protein